MKGAARSLLSERSMHMASPATSRGYSSLATYSQMRCMLSPSVNISDISASSATTLRVFCASRCNTDFSSLITLSRDTLPRFSAHKGRETKTHDPAGNTRSYSQTKNCPVISVKQKSTFCLYELESLLTIKESHNGFHLSLITWTEQFLQSMLV